MYLARFVAAFASAFTITACSASSAQSAPVDAGTASDDGAPQALPVLPPSTSTEGVLVELFSSEGCSSCPPADDLLRTFDQTQPVPGAHVIALELHVDYWNRLGWVDPYSSAQYTKLQESYGRALHTSSIYTPQMVVAGTAQLVGSDDGAARKAIARAAGQVSAHVGLSSDAAGGHVRVSAVSAEAREVWVAEVERGLTADPTAGENAGQHLAHGPVVRSLVKVGSTSPMTIFSADVAAPTLPHHALVAFLVTPTSLQVEAAAELD